VKPAAEYEQTEKKRMEETLQKTSMVRAEEQKNQEVKRIKIESSLSPGPALKKTK
jgi:hypothetical protein